MKMYEQMDWVFAHRLIGLFDNLTTSFETLRHNPLEMALGG
eukprot:CAMPEP_0184495614 /NCGR_PEP_ID=MMETSP0113_2-20130426/31849_1 /TAXON_ID=91329 /ORGANISM="Norrisiella sphaerica, Strain BC52" /LENGTH=40 /DNA_ID= /DNA_START= /DNA_END= /DNA_ORIENTATION=